MGKHFDVGSIFIIVITLILFITALFTVGFTHAILLESAVFLVSVKLIVMAYKNSVHMSQIENELTEIKKLLKNEQQKNGV